MQTNHAPRLGAAWLLPLLILATGCDSGAGALTGSETEPPPPGVSEAFTIRTSKVAVSETVMEGTFEASGIIDDKGTVREVLESPEPLNQRTSIHGETTLVSATGSITINFYAGLSRVDANTLRAIGGFYIVEGSGAYGGLQGSGKIDRVLAANAAQDEITSVLEGVIEVAGDRE